MLERIRQTRVMTTPPQSPHGPAESAPRSPYGPAEPTGQSQPQPQPWQYAPAQPPYNASQYYPQDQVPYGYTLAARTPPKRSNGPGLAALIIGIAAMVTALTPFVNFFAFLIGPAGIIVGIIGLALADRPRRMAAWGTILSAVSLVLAFVMIFVYTFGFIFAMGGVVDQVEEPPAVESEPFAPETDAAGPLPLGTVVELSDEIGQPAYEATVSASVLDANDEVLAVSGNAEATTALQWAIATIDVTALQGASSSPVNISVEFLSTNGDNYSVSDAVATPPTEGLDAVSLAAGESATGVVVIAIPTDGAAQGNWSIHYGSEYDDSERHYFDAE